MCRVSRQLRAPRKGGRGGAASLRRHVSLRQRDELVEGGYARVWLSEPLRVNVRELLGPEEPAQCPVDHQTQVLVATREYQSQRLVREVPGKND
jgi:hypothetical protein